MDGRTEMARADFFRALARTLPRAGEAPLASLPGPPRAHLMVFVNRVRDLAPGLYALVRDAARAPALRAALRPEFLWEPAAGAPADLPLYLLLPRDLRGVASQIACHQSIGGDGAFSLGMLADLEAALAHGGAAAYRRLYWECGAVGQVLYLEAEALGLRATGIGCFFDDELHAVLGLRDRAWQDLYHFTVGGAVEDKRLSTLPAYPPPDPAALDSAG
jgi:nitroreductase